MSTPPLEELYTPAILALATQIPRLGSLDAPHGEAVAHSRLCGSRVSAQARVDDQGRIADFAWQVRACALGQAAAAIVGRHAMGADLALLEQGRAALRAMLKEGAPPPEDEPWRDLAVLAPVRDVPARHAAVLLPFDAMIAALKEALRHAEEGGT